eukprot:COSAG06_NODE_22566_length_719_cov_1.275806_1_plen_28_part_10
MRCVSVAVALRMVWSVDFATKRKEHLKR